MAMRFAIHKAAGARGIDPRQRACVARRVAALGFAAILAGALAEPAAALDLNSFRAEHRLPPLHVSSEMAGAAYAHAHDLADRNRLDHNGFRARLGSISTTAAENVAYGCESEECVIRMWARSPGHRRNMLMQGVTRYGIASAKALNGRTYWVLELGN